MLPILLLLLVLIIAGVIARQGFLSAFLHFICVISAGAVAFALWEPITVGLLDSAGGFTAYLSGTTLVMLFLIVLVCSRMTMDMLVPDNLNFNNAVEWIGATIFGIGGALISVGVLTIGVGMLQFTPGGFGYTGWARDSSNGNPSKISNTPMLPAIVAARFYEFLSVGSFSPMINPGPLKQFNPDIERSSWSLARDSFAGKSGNARVWIQPKSISISPNSGFTYISDFSPAMLNPEFPRFKGAYVVTVEVNISAFDNGSQFSLSGSQARLIAPALSKSGKAATAFPKLFIQPTKTAPKFPFAFDDASNYVTSRPGSQDLQFTLIFPADEIGPPVDGQYFVQIKELRLPLPAVSMSGGGLQATIASEASVTPPSGAGRPISNRDINVSSTIPVRISYNAQGGLVIDDNNKITGGSGEFNTGGSNARISKSNRITNFFEPEGTRLVQLRAARGAPFDPDALKRSGMGEEAIVLVDATGQQFKPIGFIKKGPTKTFINFAPTRPMNSLEEIPQLPSSGNTELFLLFRAPVGATLREVRVGTTPLASMSLRVEEEK